MFLIPSSQFIEDKITDLEIPNGLPLIFDVKSKCIKLLDDGTGEDPLKKYNFGSAAPYLFRPCETEDGPDEVRFENLIILIFLMFVSIEFIFSHLS